MTRAPHELTALLSDRLAPLVPQDVVVSADGPDVVVASPIGESRNGTAAILDVDDGRPLPERVETAARAILDHVQDAVALAAGRPWPGTEAVLPLPGAELCGGLLRAWFGDRETPTVVLDDVDVSAWS